MTQGFSEEFSEELSGNDNWREEFAESSVICSAHYFVNQAYAIIIAAANHQILSIHI